MPQLDGAEPRIQAFDRNVRNAGSAIVSRRTHSACESLTPDPRPLTPQLVIRHSSFEHSNTWLPAALLATLAMLVGALQAFGGEPTSPAPLQWRRAATPSRPLSQNRAQPVRHRLTSQRDSRGFNIVQVAYNDDNFDDRGGWSSSGDSPAAGSATLKSVIVHPSEAPYGTVDDGTRLAQTPFDDDVNEDVNDGDIDDELSRELREPFGMPETPEGIDELPEPILPEPTDEPQPEPAAPEPSLQPGDREPPVTPRRIPPRTDIRDPFERSDRDPLTEAVKKNNRAGTVAKDRTEAEKNCAEEFAALKASRIANIDLSIAVDGEQGRDYPFECSIDQGELYPGRSWPQVTYMWKAAANCHKPLYFEQVELERYGHSCGPCLQPLVSGAHFFTRLPVLPYCMGLTTPNECMYPLGYYRPGNCAPYMIPAVPFTWRAALFQAGATVGTAAVLP